ncbi:MAG: hypothetical protein NTW25_02545 [Candidatus Kapabacteria bacterium]|nr:hypothetical protein [Candidatus Kapabacteria bacterium]
MKRLVIIIYILFIYNIYAGIDTYLPKDLKPLGSDLYGVISNDSTIIAYGSYGTILTSKDLGKTWIQSNIDYIHPINKVILLKDKFICLCNNKLYNSKDGLKWENISINTIDSLINVTLYNNQLYFLTNKGIAIYDSNYQNIEKIELNIDKNNLPNSIEINNNIVFIPIFYNSYLTYNLNTKQTNSIKIDISQTVGIPTIRRIQGNEIYVQINKELYLSKNNGLTWGIYSKNSIIYEDYKNLFYSINSTPHFSQNEKYEFLKIDSISKKKINKDTLFLAVGDNKLLMSSSNNGVNWNVISNFEIKDNLVDYFALDSLKMYYGTYKKYQIFKTTNGGTTWLPQFITNDSTSLFKPGNGQRFKIMFNNNGFGLCYSTAGDKGNNPPNFMITRDNGEHYSFGVINDFGYDLFPQTLFPIVKTINNKINLFINSSAYSNYFCLQLEFDDKMNYKRTLIDSLQLIRVLKTEENEIYAIGIVRKNYDYLTKKYNKFYSAIFKYDALNNNWNEKSQFSFPKLENDVFIYNPKYLLYKDNFIFNVSYGKGLEIRYKDDGTLDTIIEGFDLDSIYSLNLLDGKIDKIHFGYFVFNDGLEFENKLFLNYNSINNFLYINGNPKNSLKTWELIDTSTRLFNIADDKDFKVIYLSKYKNYFKFNVKSSPTNIVTQNNDQTYFYSYPPFPIPAMNEIKSLIYWDMSYNMDDSDIGVYDIYGNKLADRDKISINKLNAYSGYLTWDCSGVGTGVYMIQIKHGTNTHNIRAMVVR